MLPQETIAAFFPPAARSGRVSLPPMTLAHAVAFEAFDVDASKRLSVSDTALAAYLLTLDADGLRAAMADMDGARASSVAYASGFRPAELVDLAKALYATIASGYSTAVPGRQEGKVENPPEGHPATDGRSSSPT